MARFVVAPDLELKVGRIVTGPITRIAREVEAQAKENAPPLKQWVTMVDPKVRHPHHTEMHGEARPVNLRFDLRSFQWDIEHRGVGARTYLRYPRDTTSRAYVNIVNCRCVLKLDRDAIRDGIYTDGPTTTKNKVALVVISEGDYVVPAEFGTVYPGDLIAYGTFYMGRAAADVSVRRRTGRRSKRVPYTWNTVNFGTGGPQG